MRNSLNVTRPSEELHPSRHSGSRFSGPWQRAMATAGCRLSCLAIVYLWVAAPETALGSDIVVSGFNADVVRENASGAQSSRFDANGWSLVETGVVYGSTVAAGLPSSRTFTSATGSGVIYHLGPYNAPNALRLGDGDPVSNSLTVMPNKYQVLHFLAASGTSGALPTQAYTSDVTLNFHDGSVTIANGLRDYDWDIRYGMGASYVALGGLNRYRVGTGQIQNQAVFGLYESTIDLQSLGLSSRVLEGITFNNASDASNIMGVDGTVPEPATLSLLVLGGVGLIRRRRMA